MTKLCDNRYKYKIVFSFIRSSTFRKHTQGERFKTNDLKAKLKICWWWKADEENRIKE